MKKITNIIIIVLFSYSTSVFSQTCIKTDSSTTLFAPTLNIINTGNMFDITATNAVAITGFVISPSYTHVQDTFDIWYKPGTYVGSIKTQANWTLAKSYTVATTQDSSWLPQDLNITIPAGQTYAFYLTFKSPDNQYNTQKFTVGTGVGNIVGDNTTDIDVKEGASVNYPFGVASAFLSAGYKEPRVWNGTVHYCTIDAVNDLPNVEPDMNIFPNPSNGKFQLTVENSSKYNVEIFNVVGEKMYSATNIKSQAPYDINLSAAPAGIYLIQVKTEQGITARKLIIGQ